MMTHTILFTLELLVQVGYYIAACIALKQNPDTPIDQIYTTAIWLYCLSGLHLLINLLILLLYLYMLTNIGQNLDINWRARLTDLKERGNTSTLLGDWDD